MAECNACGARVSPDELFCGNCGTQQISNSPELKTVAANLSEAVEVQPPPPPVAKPPAADPHVTEQPELSETLEDAEIPAPEPAPISSESLGGSFTDNVQASGTGTPQRGTGGRRVEAGPRARARTHA